MIDYSTPGKFFVEFFPWMLDIPSSLAKWKREAREAYHYFTQFFEGMVHDVQHKIVRPYLASSSRELIHALCRIKGMNARASSETCFANAIAIT